jgi:DDE superfamily endonuclease
MRSPRSRRWTAPRRCCSCGRAWLSAAPTITCGHGTTTLFAALEVATGKITADACYPRHRHQEFLRFLKKAAAAHPGAELHIVLDNYAAHKHPEVRRWLASPGNQRITLHFTLWVPETVSPRATLAYS